MSMLAFQNCTNDRVGFSDFRATSLNPIKSNVSGNGNGGSYDGKPGAGTYYRLIPNYSCGGKAAIFAKLVVDDKGAKLATLSSENCSPVETALSFSDLDYSPSATALIGVRDGVYEKQDKQPDPEVQNTSIVEAWCKQTSSAEATSVGSSTISVYVKTNSYLGSSTATLVQTGTDGVSQASTLAVSRIVSGKSVKFSNATSTIDIDLSTLASAPTTFSGQFKGTVGNNTLNRTLQCRSGNLLDQKAPLQPLSCPTGYLAIPLLAGTSTTDICVAKFEAKQSGAAGVSQASGLPWVNVNRATSVNACRSNGTGYDLIANDEWQAVARNIENVPTNWNGGAVGTEFMNTGHSDNSPAMRLAASTDDNDSCFGTGESCSLATWHTQRRVHVLLSGQWIWDVAGNVEEWVKDNNAVDYGFETELAHILDSGFMALYGPSRMYPSLVDTVEHGGFGVAVATPIGGTVYRSGFWGVSSLNLISGGIFTVGLDYQPTHAYDGLGFRCVYHP